MYFSGMRPEGLLKNTENLSEYNMQKVNVRVLPVNQSSWWTEELF
jgi:hypothetical protein